MALNKQILFLVIATLVAILFVLFPQIDLFISGLFYSQERGFYLNRHPIFTAIHDLTRIIAISLGVIYILGAALPYFTKKPLFNIERKYYIYAFLVLTIGAGLIVNGVFKENWGRARPLQTENFGGDKIFTPAFIISDQCEGNCSFTSGDPSVGFSLFAWCFILRRKFIAYAASFGLGTILGATRVIQGAHFFSDVIFSGVFLYITAYILYKLLSKICNKDMAC
ncbi:phosphatase PAP2 family protein [Rickettsiales bacterium]|nr:phosphatase PAP2 family protein [Rickettsiales bacterium]